VRSIERGRKPARKGDAAAKDVPPSPTQSTRRRADAVTPPFVHANVEREAQQAAREVSDAPAHAARLPQLAAVPRSAGAGPPAPAAAALNTSGEPLDAVTRAFMEARFGADFDAVRVHHDAEADRAAAMLGARAFSFGSHLVFRSQAWSPQQPEGRRLLAHELAHVVQQGFALKSARSATPTLLRDEEKAVDPQALLDADAMRRWQALYFEMIDVLGALGRGEMVSATVTRSAWMRDLGTLLAQLGEASDGEALHGVEAAFEKWNQRRYDTAFAADEKWDELQDEVGAELERLADESGTAGVYALGFVGRSYRETKRRIDRIDNDVRVEDDYIVLRGQLDSDAHLWFGELRSARERVESLQSMLRVVESLRASGQDADKLVPDWFERAHGEGSRLSLLAQMAEKQHYRVEFEKLEKGLRDRLGEAQAARPRKKGLLEKGFDLVKGALSAVVDPLIEAGKQAVDLGQIALHFATFTYYDPKFISGTAKAADQGATTGDLLKGMVIGLLETPKRLYKAIENDDWEAIGRETVNLYLLARTGKQGAAAAARWLPLVRARMAGLRGGMGATAALEALKIAKAEGIVIRFRMNEAPSIRLRELGHPAKPEFLKMKSIKEVDTYLGARKADLGKVGYFEPKLPANFKRLSGRLQQEIGARHKLRLDEWNKYRGQVQSLVDRGVVAHEGQVLVEPTSGKAFTGDYDLFDIRRGTSVGDAVAFEELPKRTQEALQAKPIEAQHGAHLDWKEIPAGFAESYAQIVLESRPTRVVGGRTVENAPLIEFHPDGRIRYTYFTD